MASPTSTPPAAVPLRTGTAAGRWVLLGTVVGSGMAMLDNTVVNVALARIGAQFRAGFTALQWVVNGYTLTLASLILLGGVLGDLFGRRRIFVLGTVWFTLASVGCAASPNEQLLIAARALQGIGAALLTPGSLAIISAAFDDRDRSRAVGAWAGLGTVASAAGPLLGGWLAGIDWRLVFLINVPLAAVVIWTAIRHFPRLEPPGAGSDPGSRRIDLPGTAAVVVLLGGLSYSLTTAGDQGLSLPVVFTAALGVLGGAVFVLVERRVRQPLVHLELFADRTFTATNAVTLFVYAAMSVMLFLLSLQLQVVVGWSPLQAGLATLPMTALMLALSSRFGALADRIGPRTPMSLGPLLAAAGFALALRIGPGAGYLVDVLPAIGCLGLGMSITVAPLTSAALGAVPAGHAGAASGINNAVARSAGLLAVAVVPAVAGLSGVGVGQPAAFDHGFGVAMLIGAVLMVLAAGIARFGLPRLGAPDRPGGTASTSSGRTAS